MYNTFCVAWLVHERGVICHEPHPLYKKGFKKNYYRIIYASIIQHHDWTDDESCVGIKDDYKKLTPCLSRVLLQLVSYANEGSHLIWLPATLF